MFNGPYFQLYIYVDAIDYQLSYCLPFIALVQIKKLLPKNLNGLNVKTVRNGN